MTPSFSSIFCLLFYISHSPFVRFSSASILVELPLHLSTVLCMFSFFILHTVLYFPVPYSLPWFYSSTFFLNSFLLPLLLSSKPPISFHYNLKVAHAYSHTSRLKLVLVCQSHMEIFLFLPTLDGG